MTQPGYDNLLKQLEDLKNVQRPKTVDRLQKARAMGDLKENSEYSASREALSQLDGQIADIDERLANAEVVSSPVDDGTVELGNQVVVETNGKTLTYTIVGEVETDITANKISNTSPIGTALLGKKKGDIVEVEIPAGKIQYKILDIK
ncbi:MAG: transcription elongation factor GreA [Candidatus Roizmanbacteria bacterium]